MPLSSSIRSPRGHESLSTGSNLRQKAGQEVATETGTDRKRRAPAQSSSSTRHHRNESSSQRTRESRKERVETADILVRRPKSPDRSRLHTGHVRAASDIKPSSTLRPNIKASKHEISQLKPWSPEVSLMTHTSAPLACRRSIPPRASEAPVSLEPRRLRELSFEAQEAAMIEDLLLVLMGYEGQYIHFAKAYNSFAEKDRLAGPNFDILPGLDPSLRELTVDMLKMATHYSALTAFIDIQGRAEFGVVNHALSAAMRKLMLDYLVLIAQLETQFLSNSAFTLHALNLHTLPTRHMMNQLYSLAQSIILRNSPEDNIDSDTEFDIENILETLQGGNNLPGSNKNTCKGGSILSLITKRLELSSGDPAARAVLVSLLQNASRPYTRMLNEWLYQGTIDDLHAEFLVKEQKSINRERLSEDYTDEYWERRYTLRDNVPPQLESVQQKILLAGKYLNVVRECGGIDIGKAISNIPVTFEGPQLLDNINNAYVHANKSLLKLLLTTFALPVRLESMKRYLFLSQSDFLSNFLDLASLELRKPTEKVNISSLQSILDSVLPAQDPFKENIKVEMNSINLVDSLTRVINISGIEEGEVPLNPPTQPSENEKEPIGFNSLQFDCVIPFPASLVISRKTIWRYQALFRYLFSLRHLEQQLVGNWRTINKSPGWAHKSSNKEIELCKRRVFTLRGRMLVYVQQLLQFCTSEVIEPNWQSFMKKLKEGSTSAVGTVDELMKNHVDFLDTCLKECMLTNACLLKRHSKLMQTCTLFSNFTSWFSREIELNDPDLSGSSKPHSMHHQQWARFQSNKRHSSANVDTTTPQLEKLIMNLTKFEQNFGRNMHILLDELNHFAATETVVLLGLCARLSDVHQGTQFRGPRSKTDDGLDI